MATTFLSNITQPQANAMMRERMQQAPKIYENHCKIVPSDAPQETYAWMGNVPKPRRHVSGRNIQGLRDFIQVVVNEAWETSVIFDRDTWADDKHGQAKEKIGEFFDSHIALKDEEFNELLENGESSTDTFDGVSYFDTTRTIGTSGAINNDLAAAAVTAVFPTLDEAQTAVALALATMGVFEDDHGRPHFNQAAMQQLRLIVLPGHVPVFKSLLESTTTTIDGGTVGLVDNVFFKDIAQLDVLPYIDAPTTNDGKFYLSALGSDRKPFIFQEREKVEVVVYNDQKDIADNNGIKILCRERFRFAYMEPRRCVLHTWS